MAVCGGSVIAQRYNRKTDPNLLHIHTERKGNKRLYAARHISMQTPDSGSSISVEVSVYVLGPTENAYI
eukprot:7129526-Heterocapsa_arctica.AAC.1